MARLGRGRRLGQVDAAEAGRAVNVLGGLKRPENRPRAAGVDGHVGAPGELANAARVLCRERERHVAGNGGHPEHLKLGRGQREQERHCVVLAGVAIDDDRSCLHPRT